MLWDEFANKFDLELLLQNPENICYDFVWAGLEESGDE